MNGVKAWIGKNSVKIEPSEADWAFAKSIRDEFKRKPGSQHIASEFALAYLSALLNKVKPDSVLEFGAGIGTVTYFLMKHPANISRANLPSGGSCAV
jgi:predicted O-methyltransferase YrrM